jgi:hypothetical protein
MKDKTGDVSITYHRGGHSPRWAAEPKMMMIMMMIIIIIMLEVQMRETSDWVTEFLRKCVLTTTTKGVNE